MVKKLEDLRVYKIAEELADRIWFICIKWGVFARATVGRQFVRAVDSIGANIAEGYGRYHKLYWQGTQCPVTNDQ